MRPPFFSIVIPVYNRSNLLIKSLDYLLNQTFTDFELVLIDDGSTEDVYNSILPLLLDNPKFYYIKQENKERGAARNNGISNAKGEYIVLFDSDDFMHKNHLEILYKGIQDYNFPPFIATKFDFIDNHGLIYKSDIQKYQEGKYDYRLFLNGNPLACNICFKRGLSEFILFEEDKKFAIKEDWMFLISNLKKHLLILLDKTTITMYDHDGRSMRSGNNKIIKKTIQATEWIMHNVALSKPEKEKLLAHENYFCGIHSYLDNERKDTIQFIFRSIKYGGIKVKYLILLAKAIIGRRIILKLKLAP